jgi:lincosamide nucleotidyltransferase A/C/D/E
VPTLVRSEDVTLHLYEPRADGPMHYGSVLELYTFPVEALAGRGSIAGTDVRWCESPEWAVRWRTGYPPRPNDLHDVPLLCARFGIQLPAGF